MQLYEKFQNSYQQGKNLNLTNFEDYLNQFGINYSDFIQYFKNEQSHDTIILQDLVINRFEEIEIIAKIIGSYDNEPRQIYINLIGLPKIGKTLFLNLIQYYFIKIKGENAKNKVRIYDATDFSEQEVDENLSGILYFDEALVSMKKIDMILIDNCEKDIGHMNYNLKNIEKHLENKLIIFSWDAISWLKFTEENVDSSISHIINESETTLRLDPLENGDIVEILHKRLDKGKNEKSLELLTNELIYEVSKASFGIPGLSLRLLYLLLKEGANNNQNPIEQDDLNTILKREGLYLINDKLNDLNDISRRILYRIATINDYRGVYATALCNQIERDRSTVAYYLNEMTKLRLLESLKYGRYTFFKIRPSIIPVVYYYIWNTRRDYDE